MNQFDYKLKIEEIKRETKKTTLRKLMSRYMVRANENYQARWTVDCYGKDELVKATTALTNFKLAKMAVKRWEELGFERKLLPNYILATNVDVDIRVTLEHAVKLLGSKDND